LSIFAIGLLGGAPRSARGAAFHFLAAPQSANCDTGVPATSTFAIDPALRRDAIERGDRMAVGLALGHAADPEGAVRPELAVVELGG
jgi:hypothetical protein